jgi:hypothetical protein
MHLFFECVVAKEVWKQISKLTGVKMQVNLLSISGRWICEKIQQIPNVVHAAVLWCIWKIRNDLCFNGSRWSSMQVVFLKVGYTLARWKILCPEGKRSKLERAMEALELLARQAPQLMWSKPG